MESKRKFNINQNKDKKYRCNRIKGLNIFFNDEDENKNYNWIVEKRSNHLPIITKSLIAIAATIDEKLSTKTLNAKLQRAYSFIKRYSLSIRRITHKGQTIPETKEIIKKDLLMI